jgi:type VI protein secretion system component Hcp
MRLLRRVSGKIPLDKVRSEDIRALCKIKDINEWAHQQTIEWNEHITRMENNELVKIARDESSIGRRT